MHLRSLFVILVLAAGLPSAARAAPADDLKSLIEQGKAVQAYDLGRRHADELGNPAFDFYFGVAAIDSGRAGEGVLALERYVIHFPDNSAARLELARGYFILGDDLRAREEFEAVLKTQPAPAVVANVQRFLDALRARESRYKTTGLAYLEAGLGYDSNVNAGVDNATISLTGYTNPVTLATTGVKKSDSFLHLAAGGQVSHPVAPGVALYGSAQAGGQLHPDASQFDQDGLAAAGGVSLRRNGDLYRAGVSYSLLRVERNRYRDTLGVNAEWQRQLDEKQAVSLGAQYAKLEYEGAQAVRDAGLYGLTAGYRRLLDGAWQTLLSADMSFSHEENDSSLGAKRDDLSRDIYGLRLSAAITPAAGWSVGAGLSYLTSRYDAPDIVSSLPTRNDNYYAADVSVGYTLTRNLSLRGELLFSRNDSNLALYEYTRNLVALKLRYDFK
jgi:hypothetical protein